MMSPQDIRANEGELLYRSEDPHLLEIRQAGRFRWIYTGGDSIQSLMDCDIVAMPVFPVHKVMLAAMQSKRHLMTSALNLGFGGALIERFCEEYNTELEIDSVDCDKRLLDIVPHFFNFTDTSSFHADTAYDFLVKSPDKHYDIIFLDIYTVEQSAECLNDKEFYLMAQNKLKANGCFSMNLLSNNLDDISKKISLLKGLFPHIYFASFPGLDNLVLWLSQTQFLELGQILDKVPKEFHESLQQMKKVPE